MFSFNSIKSAYKGVLLTGFMLVSAVLGSNAARGHGGEDEILPVDSSGIGNTSVDGATVTSSLESGASSSALIAGVAVVAVLGVVGAGWVLFRNKEDSEE